MDQQPSHKNFIKMTYCLLASGLGHLLHNIAVAAHYITAEHITTTLTWVGYITASGAAYQTWKNKRLMNREAEERIKKQKSDTK